MDSLGSTGWQAAMEGWFATAFQDGARELTTLAFNVSDPTVAPCESGVLILTKSTAVAPNAACPGVWPAISCTCVAPTHATATNASEWVFRVTPIAKQPTTGVVPATVEAGDSVLEVTTIGQFELPSHVTAFRLLGDSVDNPLDFDLDLTSPIAQDGTVALILSASKNYVKEVEVAHINLANVAITDAFLPPSVTRVTLRNCAIDTLPSPFLFMRWSQLTSIDLSGNKLSSWYGVEMVDPLPESACTITSLNLAGNAFTSFPLSFVAMDALQLLNFSHNPVTNFTVSDTLYDRLASLQTLSLDGVDTSTVTEESCRAVSNRSTWKSAHGVNFCVVSTAPSDADASSSSSGIESSSSPTLVYVAVGGGVVIVALVVALFVVRKRRGRTTRNKAFSRTFDGQDSRSELRGYDQIETDRRRSSLSFTAGSLSLPIDGRLLNDPMIITSRLERKDIRLAEMLKQGGFGVVYSGVYKRRRVAVKMLRSEIASDTKLLESFVKEIALMASLKHPRIVEYIGCAWDTIKNLSMITELMDRGDLHETLQHFKQRNTPLTWASQKTRLALHIAEGLQYLHTLSPKVIHRDLKAKNVLVNSDLEAKLTDFGISREGRFEQTHMTAGIGTSFWIAPEVLAGLRYDERADIFSFGVVLSEIDTDDYPYWNDQNNNGGNQGYTQQDLILQKVLRGEMRPQFTRECPQMITVLAHKCLDADPAKRPSASEIVEYLAPVANAPMELRLQFLAFTLDFDETDR